jgi:KDO2-lipid IV(A) lauroyltransferase
MSAILYYLVLKPISLLPYWILYGISDILYLVLYKIFGYRVKVVTSNLTNSFPEKSPKEIAKIQNKFYHHLCDLIVESIKQFSLTKKEGLKRFKFTNPEFTDAYFKNGQNIIIVGGHFGNWEYIATIGDLQVKHQMAALYSPLANKFLDKKMKVSRGKYGFELISTKDVRRFFKEQYEVPSMIVFGSDQSPSSSTNAYWTRFLNQDTAVLFGAEKYSKEYNYPLIFGGIRKIKRGFYEFYFELIEENPSSTSYGELSERLTRRIEQQILEQPEYWLWSHKRWKREKPDDVVIPQFVLEN